MVGTTARESLGVGATRTSTPLVRFLAEQPSSELNREKAETTKGLAGAPDL